MTGFCDLNLKFSLIFAISVFMTSYISGSAELSMKKVFLFVIPTLFSATLQCFR